MRRATFRMIFFLMVTASKNDLRIKISSFFAKVLHIQNEWRIKKICNRNRIDFLVNYFEREKQLLINFYIIKKSKKAKSNVKKLSAISTELRNKVVSLYFELCKINYTLAFIRWRINKYGVDNEKIQTEIRKKEQQITSQEKFLYKGTDVVIED